MAAIDGIVSGLDTAALIDSLLTLESGNQSLLKTKQSTASSLVTILQSLNTKVSSLAEHSTKAAKDESWQAVKGTITQTGVTAPGATVSTSATATPGTLSFRVGAVAASQASLTTLPADAAYASGTPTFTITRDGATTTVTAASTSVADVVDAFNASGTGVTATAVKVNVLDGNGDPTGDTTYRLQLTGRETGADNAFTVSYEGTSGTTALTLDQVRAASDASLVLFPGTAAQQTLTSSSNTFEGVMTGVDLTVTEATAVDAAPLTVTVARDQAAVKSLASGLVSNLNTVLTEITSRTRSTTTTDSDGRTVVSGGPLSGDATVRLLQQRMLSEGSLPVDGVSPADVGIVIGRDGTFTFDDAKFTTAMAADPEKVQKVVQGVADRLAQTAKSASDAQNGTITQAVKSQQDTVKDLGARIDDWDDRLAMRRTSLERQYAALEVTLSNLQSQSSYLASQLAALTGSSSSS
ncbi:flagellar filament capping protein FliD [Cellulomonas sp. SLBN-39]|uniref:flagellar filament capping protein FliD n=1 Tax=Cellulomonas sp. SLBN-39 TaxID=2768446 RepID=UPI001154B016|nr:flagellar filament capping protein FliD [Cellulomonas sp. SLBN-39]TQL01644.1 flagellar hook-associated protein 2 [Cellulomonas sp. SLBN-39]